MKRGIISFTVKEKTYKFKDPLMLKQISEERICLCHEGLGLHACGTSWQECDKKLRE